MWNFIRQKRHWQVETKNILNMETSTGQNSSLAWPIQSIVAHRNYWQHYSIQAGNDASQGVKLIVTIADRQRWRDCSTTIRSLREPRRYRLSPTSSRWRLASYFLSLVTCFKSQWIKLTLIGQPCNFWNPLKRDSTKWSLVLEFHLIF